MIWCEYVKKRFNACHRSSVVSTYPSNSQRLTVRLVTFDWARRKTLVRPCILRCACV
ncbi:MAG: hypothetical protein NVSMB2_24510 [Chloroflexota bacterium]